MCVKGGKMRELMFRTAGPLAAVFYVAVEKPSDDKLSDFGQSRLDPRKHAAIRFAFR